MLSQTKICICTPGNYSLETHQYTEAASAGCILVRPPSLPFWYYQNKYEFRMTDWIILPELLERLLSHGDEELDIVGDTTLAYYNTYLSPAGVAASIKYFLEKVKNSNAA